MKDRELELIEENNESTLNDIRGASPDNPGHLHDAMVRGFERMFSLVMFILKENGKANKLTLKFAGIEFGGFDIRDIPRLAVIAGVGWLVWNQLKLGG